MSIKYVINRDLDQVKSELTKLIASEIKKDYVKTSWENNQLIIKIEKMGSSVICIALKNENGKVHICEESRKIAFTHKPFAGEVEKMVADILGNKLGAQRA
ncbi:hypothetical protein QEJ31_07820 [Pigmentibacter sp. JX0631]|uniref:hypothetical protein n=1 Tax=Pigmentibacter sp. JX0631 TaxID=2976982 RepID=UPI002469B025|nr:hypothetical protein [Pigmentibacter sp. JX0631]WGL61496.1 hypothetical protein QEJ31_07820 [Pigmentibacter sp. JX0631]